MSCFLIERYDRERQADGSIRRIHQEDFCQAFGILPELKYEREGGPGIAKCQRLLLDHAERPAADQIRFLEVVIFNYLIGNADAHGKNFSLLYRGPKPELSPAYDLLSTAIYPDLSSKMAMKIGGSYEPDHVLLRHWHRLVPDTKSAQSALNKQMKTMAEKTIENALALKEDLESKGIRSPVFAKICKVIVHRAKRLLPSTPLTKDINNFISPGMSPALRARDEQTYHPHLQNRIEDTLRYFEVEIERGLIPDAVLERLLIPG